MKKLRETLLSLMLTASSPAFCQSQNVNVLDSFSGVFIKNLRATQGEKAYLTTSKAMYAAGEPVWFHAFLLQSVSEKISTKSKNLFVDLVNEQDSVVAKVLMNAAHQQTSGRLFLPDVLPTGNYWARAYSQSILVNDPQSSAVVPLYIVNPTSPTPSKSTKKTTKTVEQPLHLEMFPEGGSLITGINTAIGFYVRDQQGNPLQVSGFIKDNNDAIVARFTTDTLGLSKAEFFPDFRRQYRAAVLFQEKEFSFPLPAFNRFAGQLSAQKITDKHVKLRALLEDSINHKDAVTYLVGVSRDSLCFASIGYGSYEADVSLSYFPMGIATFLLYDKNFTLLSERSVYVKNNSLHVSATLDQQNYAKGSKATLSIGVADQSGRPVEASLTIGVIDSITSFDNAALSATLFQRAKEGRLGNWDFLHLAAIPEQAIDLLLMSSRFFSGKAVSEKRSVSDMAEDSLFYIKGKLTNVKGEALSDQTLSLLSREGAGLFLSAKTDGAGRFLFPVSGYSDSTQFIIQMGNGKDKSVTPRLTLESFPFPSFRTPASLKQTPSLSSAKRTAFLQKYVDTIAGSKWLEQVRVDAKSKSSVNATGKPRTSSSVLTSEQLVKLGMGNVGIGVLRLPGVQLIGGKLSFYGPADMNGFSANSEPIVLMDGNQLSLSGEAGGSSSSPVIQFLNSLNPREIEYIEVFKGPEASMYGLRGGNGVIAIHTSNNIHQDFVSDEGNVFKFSGRGYTRPAVFSLSDYGQKAGNTPYPVNLQSTLYWNENQLVDKNGRLSCTFSTNNIAGRYQVVIRGLTARGDLIYQSLHFTNH